MRVEIEATALGGSVARPRRGGSIIDFMARVARCPGEGMILWSYAAIEFRSFMRGGGIRERHLLGHPSRRRGPHLCLQPQPHTAHHEKRAYKN